MSFVIEETFRRNATKSLDNIQYERGWVVWKESAGVRVPSEAAEIFTALESTVDIGSTFPSLGGLTCVEIRPECRENIEIWDVTARYEIQKAQPADDFDDFMEQSNGEGADNPENPFGPDYSGGGQTVEEYRTVDLNGDFFVNSAKQPFRNVPAIPVVIQVDRVTVNERAPADTSRQGMCDGFELLANVTYQSAEHVSKATGKRTRYYKNTYEVWTHPDMKWSHVAILDAGFKQIVDGELRDIIDPKTKEPYSEESLLDGHGKLLAANSDPQVKEFKIREEGPLNVPFF